MRIRSEELEEIFAFTLAQLAIGPQVHVINPLGFIFHRVKNDPEKLEIRLRSADAPEDGPAVILVQCKRQRDKIDKTVVKALWADVVAEGADTGVIVTTSSFSPGAATVHTARGYPIIEADRGRVREFVDALKTSRTGLYLAE